MLPVTNHGSGPYNRFVRPQRGRTLLPIGPVDRDSGMFVIQRGMTRDLRNVLLNSGTARIRSGFLEITPNGFLVGAVPMTDVIGMKYLPYEGMIIVVAYDDESGEVHVFRVSGNGEDDDVQHVGLWFTNSTPSEIPVVVLAESYQKVFMAHEEPVIGLRKPTFVYDPLGRVAATGDYAGGFLGPLSTIAEGEDEGWALGDGLIRFRGVHAWMNYLVGWGFGNNLDERPEMVRLSIPGQPLTESGIAGFEEGAWLQFGSRGSPVVACGPAGNGLMVFKEAETYPLLGTSPQTFGVGNPVDTKFGCIGPNLLVDLDGALFVWTHEGPKVTSGGPLTDIGVPLDLDGPFPPAVAGSVDVEEPAASFELSKAGFGTYVPEAKVVLFVFGGWGFALNMSNGTPSGWGYWPLGRDMRAAELVLDRDASGGGGVAAPVAGPEFVSLESATDHSLTLKVVNADNDGDEFIQTYYRPWTEAGTGVWVASPSATVTALVDSEQDIVLSGLDAFTLYEVAFRYTRDGAYHIDYRTGPSGWPAASRTFERTLPPIGLTLTWSRPAADAFVEVEWVNGEGEPSTVVRTVEKSLNDVDWVRLDLAGVTGESFTYELPGDGSEDEIVLYFRVRVLGSTGPASEGSLWTGPSPAPGGKGRVVAAGNTAGGTVVAGTGPDLWFYELFVPNYPDPDTVDPDNSGIWVDWYNANQGVFETEIWVKYPEFNGTIWEEGDWILEVTVAAGNSTPPPANHNGWGIEVPVAHGSYGVPVVVDGVQINRVQVRLRHKLTNAEPLSDYSPYTTVTEILV